MRSIFGAVVLYWMTMPAHALTPQEYRDVGITLPANAVVPMDAPIVDEHGLRRSMGDLIAAPAVLIFADYTCSTLCGPIIDFVSSALTKASLPAANKYSLIVVGIDPKDGVSDIRQMRRDHISGDPALADATTFVTADEATIRRLTGELGYRYAYDSAHDQFVHPGAAYVVRSDGKVSRVLTGLGLSAADIRLALVEAGQGKIGTLRDEVRLLCSGFDAEHGTYNLMVGRMLSIVAAATVLMLGGGIALLTLAGRRRPV